MLKRNPKIETVVMEKKEAVYCFVFPKTAKGYCLSARNENPFRLAYEKGALERGDYITVHSREEKPIRDVEFTDDEASRTIYLACDTKGETVEIE